MRALVYFAYDYNIYSDFTDDTDPAYIRISDRSANKLTRSAFQTIAIYTISIVICATFPIYHCFAHHEIHLLIPVLFPFTNLTSIVGIVVNMANQLFTASIGIGGVFGVELVVCMLKNAFGAMTSATCYSIDVMALEIGKSTQFSNRIAEAHFQNIAIQLRDSTMNNEHVY